MRSLRPRSWPRNPNQKASGKTGAVQTDVEEALRTGGTPGAHRKPTRKRFWQALREEFRANDVDCPWDVSKLKRTAMLPSTAVFPSGTEILYSLGRDRVIVIQQIDQSAVGSMDTSCWRDRVESAITRHVECAIEWHQDGNERCRLQVISERALRDETSWNHLVPWVVSATLALREAVRGPGSLPDC